MRKRSAEKLLLPVLAVLLALCRAAPLTAEGLGLWDCVERAVTVHAAVRSAGWQVEQSRAVMRTDSASFRPELALRSHYSARTYIPEIPLPGRSIELGDHHDAGVSLEAGYLLWDWGSREGRLRADGRQEEAGRQSLRSVRELMALESGLAYLGLIGARRERAISEHAVEVAREHYRHVQALDDNGLVTPDEVLGARVHLERSRVALSRSRNAERLARADLLQRIGLPISNTEVSFADDIGPIPGSGESAEGLDMVIARRPEIAAYNARMSSYEFMASSLAAGDKPRVSLFASGSYARPGLDQFRNEWIGYASAGVRFDWSFLDWGRSDYRVQEMQARWQETLYRKRIDMQQIALAIERAELEVDEARERSELAESARLAAEEHFRVVSRRFDRGLLTNREFVDSREDATSSEIEAAAAGVDLARARWRLAWARGLLLREIESRWPEIELGDNYRFNIQQSRRMK